MKKSKSKRILPAALALVLLLTAAGCASAGKTADYRAVYGEVHTLVLSSEETADGFSQSAVLDGKKVAEYDYTWHADPSSVHDEVKDAPAEYYTGTAPTGEDAVYVAHDIYYYPELDENGFTLVNYDGEREYAYYYTADGLEDYIFTTLPVSGGSLPSYMMHGEDEAYDNPVLHIAQAGTYLLSGSWHGQILIDLGDTDDTFTDEDARVTLILDGVDVECTVAPSIIFYSVYECDNAWEDAEEHGHDVNTENAGAAVVIADGSENNFTGANVYRMLKTKYKDDGSQPSGGVKTQKKMRKTDGAFYSYVSMNIDGWTRGDGILNITSTTYEGLDSELHLTVNGGSVNINSQDDGINVNEDNVSVVTVNGGSLHIMAGLGSEGDGIDSNGYIVINGGVVISSANPASDSGLDSDCGSFINGGYVIATGSTMDRPSSDSGQPTVNLQFSQAQGGDEAIVITKLDGTVVFAYDPSSDEAAGSNVRNYRGAVISCPELEEGGEYYIYVGGDVTGDDVNGLYDASTVTEFTGTQQQYSGVGSLGGRGGFDGGFNMPQVGGGQRGEMPDGSKPPQFDGGFSAEPPGGFNMPQVGGGQDGEMPDGSKPPRFDGGFSVEPPDGFNMPQVDDGGQNGESADGSEPVPLAGDFGAGGGLRIELPEGFDLDKMRNGGQRSEASDAYLVFRLSSAVNTFSGVSDRTDAAHDAAYEQPEAE